MTGEDYTGDGAQNVHAVLIDVAEGIKQRGAWWSKALELEELSMHLAALESCNCSPNSTLL